MKLKLVATNSLDYYRNEVDKAIVTQHHRVFAETNSIIYDDYKHSATAYLAIVGDTSILIC
jgi:hypothetical protein